MTTAFSFAIAGSPGADHGCRLWMQAGLGYVLSSIRCTSFPRVWVPLTTLSADVEQ